MPLPRLAVAIRIDPIDDPLVADDPIRTFLVADARAFTVNVPTCRNEARSWGSESVPPTFRLARVCRAGVFSVALPPATTFPSDVAVADTIVTAPSAVTLPKFVTAPETSRLAVPDGASTSRSPTDAAVNASFTEAPLGAFSKAMPGMPEVDENDRSCVLPPRIEIGPIDCGTAREPAARPRTTIG